MRIAVRLLLLHLPLIACISPKIHAPKGIKRTSEMAALMRKYNLHVRDCPGVAPSSFSDRVLKSAIVSNSKAAVIARISKQNITDCLPSSFNFSHLPRHFDGSPNRFAKKGRCRITDKDKPYEAFECICSYGNRGIYCQHEMTTKTSLLWIWWTVTLVALLFIIAAIFRFMKRKIFSHSMSSQRFVDIIVSHEL